MFYLLSRVSQIYKNYSRHATEGLSLHMFGCIVTANLLYVAGILVRARDVSDVTTAAPWLLGTARLPPLCLIPYDLVPRHV